MQKCSFLILLFRRTQRSRSGHYAVNASFSVRCSGVEVPHASNFPNLKPILVNPSKRPVLLNVYFLLFVHSLVRADLRLMLRFGSGCTVSNGTSMFCVCMFVLHRAQAYKVSVIRPIILQECSHIAYHLCTCACWCEK